jgi:hypothetical protein
MRVAAMLLMNDRRVDGLHFDYSFFPIRGRQKNLFLKDNTTTHEKFAIHDAPRC